MGDSGGLTRRDDWVQELREAGGFPLPARTYSARSAAYFSASTSIAVSLLDAAASNSFRRKGTHQPQPVPAPPHSLISLGTRGLWIRMKFTTFL